MQATTPIADAGRGDDDQPMWAALRARLGTDDLRSAFVDALRMVDRLSARDPAEADHVLTAALPEWQGHRLRALYLVLVARTGGPDGTAPTPGGRPSEQLLRARQEVGAEAARSTALDDQLTADDVAAAQAYGPIDARLDTTVRLVAAGEPSDAVVETLRQAVSDYREVIASSKASAAGARILDWKLANALYWLGQACIFTGDDNEARRRLGEARDTYEGAGDRQAADVCRAKITEINQRQSPDADMALKGLLGQLDSARPATLDHVEALVGLAQLSASQGDLYGAELWVGKATVELGLLHYPVPENVTEVDATVARWIDAIPDDGAPGTNRFYDTLATLIRLHSALAAVQQVTDPSRAADWEAVIDRLFEIVAAVPVELAAVDAELQAQLKGFQVPGWDPASTAASAAHARKAAGDAAFLKVMRGIGRLQDGLGALTTEGVDPRPAVASAAELVATARSLGSAVTIAQALLTQGQVLKAAGQPAAAVAPLEEAQKQASAFGGSTGRDVAILALSTLVHLHVSTGDYRRASDTAGEAISRIERDRYRVNAPYLQSSYLGNYMNVFVGGIFSAFKLGEYDTMLARTELSKAHASVRAMAHLPATTDSVRVDDLDRELRSITAEIRHARTNAVDELPGLLEKRQRLWDLRAIQHRDEAGDPPRFSLSAVREALEPDEATLYYYWLSSTVLLVVTITGDGIEVERKILAPEDRSLLERFIDEIKGLKGSNLSLDANFIEPLARALLPERGLILLEGKQRLAVSPHRLLHWFPFHALPWGDVRVAQRFAVRYIPNLTSLLVHRTSRPEPLVVGVGVSHFPPGEGLPDLAGVAEETNWVASTYRSHGFSAEVLLDATRGQIYGWAEDGTLSRAACMHLTTHGDHVSANAPMESLLFVTDGRLDGLEIASWHLDCEVVVLGSCDSGQRAIAGRGMSELPGDELFGLPAAFLAAGARSVLAAAWPADNEAASTLIRSWHQHLAAGDPADVALHRAQCEFLERATLKEQRAYFWAPFFLVSVGALAPLPRPARVQPSGGVDG